MTKQRIDKSYVSELDRFLQEFDEAHPEKSESQIEDIKKSAGVAQLRDHVISSTTADSKIWEEFYK